MTRLNGISTIFMFTLLVSACTHINQSSFSTTGNPATSGTPAGAYIDNLINVSLTTISGATSGTNDLQLSLAVDPTASGFKSLTQYCSSTDPTLGCVCEMDWNELNNLTSPPTTVARTKKVSVTQVQSGLVECVLSSSFWNTIASGTTVQMTITPASTNNSGLSVQPIGYKIGTTVSSNGDFLDSTLNPFRNVHRYSCYTKMAGPYEVLNEVLTSGSVSLPVASRFCTSASGGNCTATPRSGYTSQSYYRNLYARSDALGTINSSNDTYDCPTVYESILYSAGQTIPQAQQGQYWPLDTTFALSTTYSSDWSVGVHAASVLYKSGDVNSDPTLMATADKQCQDEGVTGAPNTRLLERGITIKCLGYAKRPNTDGTCGTMVDSTGRTRYLTRLRRFRAIYPQFVQPSGQVASGGINEADEIYVADRLVVNSSGVPTGAMIYGPKPCNFAWFDHEGVTNRSGPIDFGSRLPGSTVSTLAASYGSNLTFPLPGYVATSNYQYVNLLTNKTISVNPDGLIFPNRDLTSVYGEGPSCSAALAVVDYGSLNTVSGVHLVTSSSTRINQYVTVPAATLPTPGPTATPVPGTKQIDLSEVHLNPIDAWTPNYVEDTSFQACVPLSDPYLEPPLEIYKQDSNTYAWCAKAYPTQNPNYGALNSVKRPSGITPGAMYVNYPSATPSVSPANTALVSNYTSHNTSSTLPASAILLDSNNSCTGTLASTICTLMGTSTAEMANCTTYLTVANRATCDRTAMPNSASLFTTFPLQAAEQDIVTMLKNDLGNQKNYSCQYSVNPDATKVGQNVPSSACCGVVNGTAILSPVISGAAGSYGHLEPYVSPTSPTVRFCGSPVQ